MKILDLGCNNNVYLGTSNDTVIGLDYKQYPKVDILHDLEKTPLPFKNNSFDMVRMDHVLEHIHNRTELIEDILRILKVGGKLVVITPHHTNPISAQIEHKIIGFGFHAFVCLPSIEIYNSYNSKHRFRVTNRNITLVYPFGFLNEFADSYPDFYEWRLSKLIPAVEIKFVLIKEKNRCVKT